MRNRDWIGVIDPCAGTTTVGPLIPNHPRMVDADTTSQSSHDSLFGQNAGGVGVEGILIIGGYFSAVLPWAKNLRLFESPVGEPVPNFVSLTRPSPSATYRPKPS